MLRYVLSFFPKWQVVFKIELFSVKHVWLRGEKSFSAVENCKIYGWEMNVSTPATDVSSHKHLDTVVWCQLSRYFRYSSSNEITISAI